MRLEVSRASMDDFFPGVFVLGIGTELRPPVGEAGLLDWRLCGAISNLVINGLFTGETGEHLLFWSRWRGSKVYIFGTGESARPPSRKISSCAEEMVKVLANAGESEAVVLPEHLLGVEEEVDRAGAFLAGILNGVAACPERSGLIRFRIAGGPEAQVYHEAIRKAMNKKGTGAGKLELVYNEAQ